MISVQASHLRFRLTVFVTPTENVNLSYLKDRNAQLRKSCLLIIYTRQKCTIF